MSLKLSESFSGKFMVQLSKPQQENNPKFEDTLEYTVV